MASIRRQILLALRDRIATLPGWDVQITGGVHDPAARILADVFYTSESKDLANSEEYEATLSAGVLVTAMREDAQLEDEDEGNDLLYLERLCAQAEQSIHSPLSWPVVPDFTRVRVTGHDVIEPSDSSYLMFVVQVEFLYRHHVQDLGA